MRYSLISSLILHVFIFLLTIVSLPLFNTPKLDIPPIIQVELIEISEKTNVPKINKKEEKKEEVKKDEKKEEVKINQPIIKPKDEKSDEKVKDPVEEEKIIKNKIEAKMIENMPVRKPEIKKEDKFDPLKLAELIDMQKDTIMENEDEEDLEYEAFDDTPSISKKLTFSEEDAIRAQFIKCWVPPIGIPYDETYIVKIKIFVNKDGSLSKPSEMLQHERMNKPDEKYFKVLAESALRAVRICDPLKKVPDINKYDDWKTLQLNFDPRQILR